MEASKDKAYRASPPRFTPPNPQQIRSLSGEPRSWLCREEVVLRQHCFTISPQEQPRAQETNIYHPDAKEKGYFVMQALSSAQASQSNDLIEIPFQINSTASCITLPFKYLISMPCANLVHTSTVLQPYAGPPIHPIGQLTLKPRRGLQTDTLTSHAIDTN